MAEFTAIQLSISNGSTLKQLLLKMPKSYLLMSAVFLFLADLAHRGIEGKIEAIRYARTHNIPFLGLCLGMQLSIVEFARDVIGYKDAHSMELNPDTTHPVIHIMEDQIGIEDIGGTLRLGSYPCVLKEDSLAYRLYGTKENP